MKNKKKRTILLIGLVVIICLTIGYFIHKNKKENYIETQEERLNLYFKYNLKNYNSMHVTSFRKNPMGAYYISGYVNKNKKYHFKAKVSTTDNLQFKGDFIYNPKTFGKLLKNEEGHDSINTDEIIKKKHLDKTKYEAYPPAFFWF
ncbi:DUF1433 domain-containing protein [Staphylococcus caprae]|uniref:DUF1433 domain-containing protein n=2 Tax=Staphylococcus caprae TaxID=29380 RepID=UPI001C104957|nr:DUF1433 domain-containing protein [Staphylococcus caprae]MBU5271318.1 DUF1433 domain-containing protein [Staphylococcus caprae]MDK6297044.1 DUF1433 domain-containing protein [Staphylococcus caprae]MDK7232832.1 DUF1433 domain-containing protein [Staphylococcus caprae]